MIEDSFRDKLEDLINCHSMECGSNTPDFILADYLTDCLWAFDKAVNTRSAWYGEEEDPNVVIDIDPLTTVESADVVGLWESLPAEPAEDR